MVFQTHLKIWQEDYNSDYYLFDGALNFLVNVLLNESQPVFFVGPKKSGKKHLLYKISMLRSFSVFFLDMLTDSEIVYQYDKLKTHSTFAIFVSSDVYNFSSKDVFSRMGSLPKLQVDELSSRFFLAFLTFRINKIGVFLDPYLFNYSITRLNQTYESIDSFIKFLKISKSISLKTLKTFFNS
ncbi:hypothetical protein [Alphaproteobacteria bacterium endosymbiont of Tiliacea citrago]|uniref:hypothetical protein n=1 Tax=Alphaproteobacteria bacterium endosymbiont of Tiliacea citrago TaxID=3077944 RepID=UPI00313D5D99